MPAKHLQSAQPEVQAVLKLMGVLVFQVMQLWNQQALPVCVPVVGSSVAENAFLLLVAATADARNNYAEAMSVRLVSAVVVVVLRDRHTVQVQHISLCHLHHLLQVCQDRPKTVVAAFAVDAVMADMQHSQAVVDQAHTLIQLDPIAVHQALVA